MQRQMFGIAFVLLTVFIPVAAQVNGRGTTDYIPVWTQADALGNSTLFQSNGMVGLGTTTPKATLSVIGQNGQLNSDAPLAFQVIGGKGSLGFRKAFAGGPIQLIAGVFHRKRMQREALLRKSG